MNTSSLLDLLSLTALKGAVVLLVALLLGLGLQRMAASRRYALWITAIATLAILPLAMWVLPAWRVLPKAPTALDRPMMEAEPVSENAGLSPLPEDLDFTASAAGPALPLPAPITTRPAFSWNISWQDVVEYLPVVWMLIAGLLVLRLGRSAWRLQRLEASLSPGECALLIRAARDLGLRRIPRLLIGPSDSVPMVWGVLKPRLLLPSGFETWSPEKQRGVLLHELAHLKRGDPFALWAAQWVKALHWFNPLVWLTFRQLRADQERACDDAVLRHGVRASDYAQSLLDLSRHNRLAPGLSLCALTITRCAPVEARVKAILDPRRRRDGLNLRWLAGLAGCALLITLPVAMLHAIEDFQPRGRILDRNGVVLAESTKEKGRVYPLKSLAAHMVGYTRVPDEGHGQTYGGAALEKQQNAELAAGKDVALTLDMRVQSLAYRAMKEAGVVRGAAVVLDPRTGEILASVSLPSFDPNLFVPSISHENWERYLNDQDVPLLNRCLKGFAPGSTFKMLTGLAGSAAGMNGQKFNCTGSVTYGNDVMRCWIHSQNGGGHGVLGMSDSLAVSCNCYWYQFGNAVGIEQIESMGRIIGFGSAYGITEDENAGILPCPDWQKQHHPKESWSAGHTANTAIGQGYMLATPLQMAVLAATVGNSGRVPQPGIIKQKEARPWRRDLTQDLLNAADVDPLREGMRLAVNSESGTGRPARSDKVAIAGKTGTVQNWRILHGERVEANHGWFIGFAPYERPQLAFAIIKQGAKTGGGDCGPIAKRIVEEALALPADGSGEVKPVEEKIAAVQAPFDFNAAEISREIKLLGAEPKIYLKELKVGNGEVTILAEASEMDEAIKLLKSLGEIGERRLVKWSFPYPRSLENGRVGFRASGVYQPSPSNTEEGSKKAEVAHQWLRSFKKTTAKVIGRSSGSLVINRGSLDGIVANSPVITSVGLVGKTDTPEPYFTKVILLTDELCRVSAKVEGTQEQGILNGEKVVRDVSPQLHLRFLSRQAKIDIGSRVSSSGEGGVFPAGLYLGRVKQFKTGDISGEAIVEPDVDFSTLEQVFVIEQKTESPAQEAPTPPKPADQAQLRQQNDAEIRMKPALAKQWAALKRAGLLADLPASAGPFDLGNNHPERQMKSVPEFHFWTSRVDLRRWLVDSHCSPAKADPLASRPSLLWEPPAVEDIAADWPAPPEPFQRTYAAAGHCEIHIASSDGENVTVTIRQKRHSILIAPDEFQPPRPAGKLAPEYPGKSLSQSESALPTLDATLQTLRSTISPEEEKRLPWFLLAAPIQYNLQASNLPSEARDEEEALLRNSRTARNRAQQALLVRPPQMQ